jgi:hypothetical protein
MPKKKKTGALHPCQNSQVIRAPARKPLVRAKVAQTRAAGQLGAADTELQEDDWVARQLPTFD